MRERIFQTYKKLKTNNSNYIVYFDGNKRMVKTFKDFYNDVETCIARLDYLKNDKVIENIALIGPTSYKWMVLDHACLKGGYKSVALPETYSIKNLKEIYNNTKIDITLCDFNLKDLIESAGIKDIFFFNCIKSVTNDFNLLKKSSIIPNEEESLIRKDYTIVFSSGTSDKVKRINWSFSKKEPKPSLRDKIRFLFLVIRNKLSLWSREENKVIIFMPFSHPINRLIATHALFDKTNIIISDPKNCFKHIITEKPNIMFAVPPVYEAIAQNIKLRIDKFTDFRRILFGIFNSLNINTLSNGNPIKMIFSFLLFKKMRKIYGGKADYFVTGSAPINPEVLRTFYSIGVKVYEAYGQTESSNIMNTPKHFRIGSVGRPKKGTVKISEEGELLLKYEENEHIENKDILNIKNNWIHSGDLAYIDNDGYVFIQGRKDDTIVLENGKKINPFFIERKITAQTEINHAIVFSHDKLNLKAIVYCSNEKSTREIKDCIANINNELSGYERIRSVYQSNEPFSIDNGLLTSTLKLKRKAIVEKYGNEMFEPVLGH